MNVWAVVIGLAIAAPVNALVTVWYLRRCDKVRNKGRASGAGAHFKREGANAPCWVIRTSEGFSFPVTSEDMNAVLDDVAAAVDPKERRAV